MSGTRSALAAAVLSLLTPDGAGNVAANQSPAQFDNSDNLATTDFVQRALGSYSGVTNYVANTQLTVADMGKSISASVACTLTLPPIVASQIGAVIEVFASSNSIVVKAAGTDSIGGMTQSGASVTSITLNFCDTVKLRNGGSNWIAVAGSTQLGASGAFASSIANGTSGYQKIPGGLVIQWVRAVMPSTAGGINTLTWPISFPSGNQPMACAFAPDFIATSQGYNTISLTNRTASGANVENGGLTAVLGAIAAFTVIAIGF